MFDQPPKREYLSWLLVVLWSALIFASVPFARALTSYVGDRWGPDAFTYGVAAAAVLTAVLALRLVRRRRSVASYAVLAGVAGAIIYLTFDLAKRSPSEAIHFPQYGVLSLLLYRAFAHRVHDWSVYIAAAIAGTIVGLLDETIQWLTPGRHFATRDVWLNCTAVALVQVALAFGIRPRIIAGPPGRASLRRLCHLAAGAVAYLGLVHLNTAERIAWYAPHVPFIDADHVPMVEYGYLHEEGEKLRFKSRLTADELRLMSRERAGDGSRILDEYRGRARYGEFLSTYGPGTDPFLHEARVHLFSRDVNLELARDAETPEERTLRYTIAHWENHILENYFGELLAASSYRWSPETRSEAASGADLDRRRQSVVSENLIVGFTERQLAGLFLGLLAVLLALGVCLGERKPGRWLGRMPLTGRDPAQRRRRDG